VNFSLNQLQLGFKINKIFSKKTDEFKSKTMNILFFCLGSKNIYRDTIFTKEEIFCSPDCKTTFEGDRLVTLQTPVGFYDIENILKQIPIKQKPDLIVVQPDATSRNFPYNLHKANCPKVLCYGDTHHFQRPIQTLLNYAKQEKFDSIVAQQTRHHLHYFKEIGYKNTIWLPGLMVNPYYKTPSSKPQKTLSFVGQVGNFHLYRKYILSNIRKWGFPLTVKQASQSEAADIYQNSLINLNISLNGDFNLRVFEILASGGFLLTESLTKQAGLNLLFDNGRHLVTFQDELELQYQISFFLSHPEVTREIAHEGNKEFWDRLNPELNIKRFFDYIDGKDIDSVFTAEKDKRSVYSFSETIETSYKNISIYEYIQELHRLYPRLRVLFWPQVDFCIVANVIDLPRLDVHLILNNKNCHDFSILGQCEIVDQITFQHEDDINKNNIDWDILAFTWKEIQNLGIDSILNDFNFQWLIITNSDHVLAVNQEQELDIYLEQCGFIKISQNPLVYYWKRKVDWGNWLFVQQKLHLAIKIFNRVLQEDPYNFNVLFKLAQLSYQLHYLEETERLLRECIAIHRRHPEALEEFAKVLLNLNKYQEAKQVIEYILSITPQNAQLWFLLHNCYQKMGQISQALLAYRRSRKDLIHQIKQSSDNWKSRSHAKTELKTILVINNLYPPQELGGYGRYISDFANLLRDRGHTVKVLTTNESYLRKISHQEEHVERELSLFGTYEELPPQILKDNSQIQEILEHNNQIINECIERHKPDVCLVGNIDFLSASIFQPFLEKQIPIIHHVAFNKAGYLVEDTPKSPLYHLSACSHFTKQKILESEHPLENISVIYPGAFVENFQNPFLPKLDKLKIAFAGLVMQYKGPQTLLEALKILHDAGVDFQCSIAGAAPVDSFLTQLKNFTKSAGMENKVDFLGYLEREQLLDLYATHNVFVFPSVWEEPFGISQVEGMASGLLLISSGTGGASEVIEHEESGLKFPPGNARALADLLLSLLSNREKWKRLIVSGKQRAMNLLNIETSIDLLEEKFEELLRIRDNDETFLIEKIQVDLRQNLRLQEVCIIVFPDWETSEETIATELSNTIGAIAKHPEKQKITLLIDTTSIDEEDANLLLSGIAMNLLMEEDLNVENGPEISLLGQLNDLEWRALLPLLTARISLQNENQQAIASVGAENIPTLDLASLENKRIVQKEDGRWKFE
jgi:glycosyltransferase involved in cell wall biosynthesis